MKYKNNAGVAFFVEPFQVSFLKAYIVVSQAPGFPKTEACGDCFTNKKDAMEVAKQLSMEN